MFCLRKECPKTAQIKLDFKKQDKTVISEVMLEPVHFILLLLLTLVRLKQKQRQFPTRLSQGTGVWGVWVSVIITEVFGNIVSSQFGHNVWDVSIRAEVLQPFMSTT